MSPFGRRRTFESVARELIDGLADGSVVLNEPGEAPAMKTPEQWADDALTRQPALQALGNLAETVIAEVVRDAVRTERERIASELEGQSFRDDMRIDTAGVLQEAAEQIRTGQPLKLTGPF